MSRDIGQILRSIDNHITYRERDGHTYVYYNKRRVGVILWSQSYDTRGTYQYHSLPPVPRLKTTSEHYFDLQALKDYLEVV